MARQNRKNDQSTSQEEQLQTDAHSASLPMQLQQFVPYIEGPKMDWTVNDGLYHWFLKWKLKCENILDCELATLSETRQCKKLIAWSGDDGMDLVVSWGLTNSDLTLATLWTKFEDFCKPQSNEVRAQFDLQALGKGTNRLMNGSMQFRSKSICASTLQKLPVSCKGTYSGST